MLSQNEAFLLAPLPSTALECASVITQLNEVILVIREDPMQLPASDWLVRVRKSVLSGSERDRSDVSPTPSREPPGTRAGLQQEPSLVSCSVSLPSSLDGLLQISVYKSLVQDFPSQALLCGKPAQANTVSSGETFPDRFHPLGPLEWPPSAVFLPGEFHEERSLAGGGPWGHEEWTQLRN